MAGQPLGGVRQGFALPHQLPRVLTLDAESRHADAKTEGVIVIEVDDLFEAGSELRRRKMERLAGKLKFGKAVNLQKDRAGTGYAGRRVCQLENFSYSISMDDHG